MRIQIQTENPKISAQELREATRFMYSLLVEDDDYKRTTIKIVSKPFKKKNRYAVLEPNKKRKPIYTIFLNTKYSRKKQLSSLAHELIHVKQFITEELGGTWEVDGELFTKWYGMDVSEKYVYYTDLPWETEAFGRQFGLYKRYELYKAYKTKV